MIDCTKILDLESVFDPIRVSMSNYASIVDKRLAVSAVESINQLKLENLKKIRHDTDKLIELLGEYRDEVDATIQYEYLLESNNRDKIKKETPVTNHTDTKPSAPEKDAENKKAQLIIVKRNQHGPRYSVVDVIDINVNKRDK